MRWLTTLPLRLRSLFRSSQVNRELDDEVRFHLDRQIEQNIANGMSRAEARQAALVAFGGLEQQKELCRETRKTAFIESAIDDTRFAWRSLRKSPVFTCAAVLTLAIGIGATVAVFSIMNAVFLRPLPYTNPERLAWVTEYWPNFKRAHVFAPQYVAWKKQLGAFERLEAFGISIGANLSAHGRQALRVPTAHVTTGFFDLFGIPPRHGRTFTSNDGKLGSAAVAVISHELWRNYFNANPNTIGSSIRVNGDLHIVAGVMPERFNDPTGPDTGIWLPDAITPTNSLPGRGMGIVDVVGRLAPASSIDRALAELNTISRQMDNQFPLPWSRYHRASRVQVVSLQNQFSQPSQSLLYLLMCAAGSLLLIGCSNIANLFLSRSLNRQRELAVRAAVGASTSRLMRFLLAENMLIGFFGGTLGIALAYGIAPTMKFIMPGIFGESIPIDFRVLAFASACSLFAVAFFGLLPAFAGARVDLNIALKDGRRLVVKRRRSANVLQNGLVVVQLTLSAVLLLGAGLLLRSFVAASNVDPGYDPRHVVTADLSLAPLDIYLPKRQVRFFDALLQGLKNKPGVGQVGLTSSNPMTIFNVIGDGFHAEGREPSPATVGITSANGEYFRALHVPLLAGRLFDEHDREGSQPIAILNQSLAKLLFGTADPVGRRVSDSDGAVTVVGVVGDFHHGSLDTKIFPELFRPYQQAPSAWMSLVLRSDSDARTLEPLIRQMVQGVDATQPVFEIQNLDDRLSRSFGTRRSRAFALTCFSVIAMAIALIGVYGVMAYSVTQRTHEIGIRLALGAQQRQILMMLVQTVIKLALASLVLSIPLAYLLTRTVASFLFGVTPTDTVTLLSVFLTLFAGTVFAAFIPARRGMSVNVNDVMKSE